MSVVSEFNTYYDQMLKNNKYDELLEILILNLHDPHLSDESMYYIVATYSRQRNHKEVIAKAEKYLDQMKDKTWIARTYNRLASSYWHIGQISHAVDLFKKAEELIKSHGNTIDKASILNNLGITFEVIGDYEKALDYYNKSLELKMARGHDENDIKMGSTYVNLGNLYFQMNELGNARYYFEKAFNIYNLPENNNEKLTRGAIISCYYLFIIAIKENSKDEGMIWFERLENDLKDGNSAMYNYYLLAKGANFKSSLRMADRIKSIEIFQEVKDREENITELSIIALINLVEFKLDEFKMLSDKEVKREIQDLIETIIQFALQNQLYPQMITGFILQARFAEINLHYSMSLEFYNQASAITEKYGLNHLTNRVKDEQDLFIKRLENFKSIYSKNKEIIEEIDKSSILSYLKTVSDLLL
jgi:tetratricopeptide (TPR) repeat protein